MNEQREGDRGGEGSLGAGREGVEHPDELGAVFRDALAGEVGLVEALTGGAARDEDVDDVGELEHPGLEEGAVVRRQGED